MGRGMWDGTGWYAACSLATDGNMEKLGQGMVPIIPLGGGIGPEVSPASPTCADHIRAELPWLFPLPTHGVPILATPPKPFGKGSRGGWFMRAHRAGSGDPGDPPAESEEHPMLGTSHSRPSRGTSRMEKAIIRGSPEEPPGSFHLLSFVSGLLCK